jgi:uncharacterized protein (DUF3084 family)
MSKPTPYAAARDALTALERELATIDDAIKRAGMSSDLGELAALMTRKQILPVLLSQARRTLVPLEVAVCEAELERVKAEMEPIAAKAQAAHARMLEAQREVTQHTGELTNCHETVRQLEMERKTLVRRAQSLEQPQAPRQGPVVHSTWQAR